MMLRLPRVTRAWSSVCCRQLSTSAAPLRSFESATYPGLFYHPIDTAPTSYSMSFLPTPPPSLSFSPTTLGILSHPRSSIAAAASSKQELGVPEVLPRNFQENEDFYELLHDVLRELVLKDPGISTLGLVRQSGYIHVADERNPADPNRVPDPSDIIASILIQDSKVTSSAYEISRTHRLVTMQGMMKLSRSLHDALLVDLKRVRQAEIEMHSS